MKKEIQAKLKLLSLTQATRLVQGITVQELRELCLSGKLPYIKAGKRYFVQEDVLLDFVKIPYCPHIIAIEESAPFFVDDFDGYSGLEALICPYCGHSHGELDYDLWELEDVGKYVCDDCGRTMKFSRNYLTCFRSEPMKRKEKRKSHWYEE